MKSKYLHFDGVTIRAVAETGEKVRRRRGHGPNTKKELKYIHFQTFTNDIWFETKNFEVFDANLTRAIHEIRTRMLHSSVDKFLLELIL